jgi:serine/threonine protein phosphatase PrpC
VHQQDPVPPVPPVYGRPSPASSRPGALRPAASAASAAYRADGGDGAVWSVRAASVAGVHHRLAGRGPEDAYAWRVLDAGPAPTVILALADGVGSVERSAEASAAAVDAACACLAAQLVGAPAPAADARAADARAADARAADARAAGARWREAFRAAAGAVDEAGGATTLVVAVVGADGRGALARVGDSTAFLLDDGQWTELWPPIGNDDGPVSTATAALSAASGRNPAASGRNPAAAPAIEVAEVTLGVGRALVLASDGIANPLRDGPTTVAPALAAALAAAPTPLGLAVVVDFSRQGCFDDRTLLGLWPHPDEA